MNERLVTLISPCYNAEKYIERFLDSVLAQTYGNIQFILVNDGSTDRTDELISNYSDELRKTMREFRYIVKENGGPGSAVNTALKYVNGEYLSWADVDDYLYPENIREKANFLDSHPEFGLCACNAEAIDFESGRKICDLKFSGKDAKLFRVLLFGPGVPCYPGVFMIRYEILRHRLREGSIYHFPDVGQNYQLLFPVVWDNDCGFIDKCLYSYYSRADSHHNSMNDCARIKQTFSGEEVITNTMHFLSDEDKQKLFPELHRRYAALRFRLALNMTGKYYREMRHSGESLCSAATMVLKALLKPVLKFRRH